MGINPANGCAENCETCEGDGKFHILPYQIYIIKF